MKISQAKFPTSYINKGIQNIDHFGLSVHNGVLWPLVFWLKGDQTSCQLKVFNYKRLYPLGFCENIDKFIHKVSLLYVI